MLQIARKIVLRIVTETKFGITLFLLTLLACFPFSPSQAQQCTASQICKPDEMGKEFDFRGQSTYARFSPGDSCKVQAVLYSGNEAKIMICSDPKLGIVQFKVFKTVSEYKRIIDKIEKIEKKDPIYKTDKKGKPVPLLDDWGKPQKDIMGDIQFEIANYKSVFTTDTTWKIERKSRDEILFDSRKGSRIFTSTIKQTEPIMIEIFVPKTTDAKLKQFKGCVGIMIGRIFKSTNFKGFSKS